MLMIFIVVRRDRRLEFLHGSSENAYRRHLDLKGMNERVTTNQRLVTFLTTNSLSLILVTKVTFLIFLMLMPTMVVQYRLRHYPHPLPPPLELSQ